MKRLVCNLLFIFMAASLWCETLFAQSNESGVHVIVIDAGHGGKAFPGAVYGGVKEKDINLKVALKLGALIEAELPQIKVVYTRKSDTALGQTLNDDLTKRAEIANKAEGDFFISIHANAAPSKTVSGAETIIMGESEKETRYNESALYNNNKDELIDMSDANTAAMVRAYIQNLQFTYGEYSEMMARIIQSHYATGGRNARRVNRQLLKVLYATDMPSVLTELGFMTNSKELAFMISESGQDHYARILCDAVKEYVGHIKKLSGAASQAESTASKDDTTSSKSDVSSNNATSKKETTPKSDATVKADTSAERDAATTVKDSTTDDAVSQDAASVAAEGYAIQLLASDKAIKSGDAQFKSYRGKVSCYMGAGVLKYKYCYGMFATRAEAQRNLAEVKRSFKDAFVVHYMGERIVK